jgi:hypothetical protein
VRWTKDLYDVTPNSARPYLVVDHAVVVKVVLGDHLANALPLAQNLGELLGGDHPVAVAVVLAEGPPNVVLVLHQLLLQGP